VVRTKEPEQQGERRLELRKPAALPIVLVGYHVPESKHADNDALQVLGTLLTQGRSSRLYKRMVDKDQLVLNVGGGVRDSLDPGLFMFTMQVRSGVDPRKAEAALYEELERVAKEGVPEEEMQKVRNQVLAAVYRSLQTISGKANLIGQAEVFAGDYRKINTLADDLAKVTAEQVKQVAAKYLTAKNRTVGTLIPERGGEGQ
jgi:zinc protease